MTAGARAQARQRAIDDAKTASGVGPADYFVACARGLERDLGALDLAAELLELLVEERQVVLRLLELIAPAPHVQRHDGHARLDRGVSGALLGETTLALRALGKLASGGELGGEGAVARPPRPSPLPSRASLKATQRGSASREKGDPGAATVEGCFACAIALFALAS